MFSYPTLIDLYCGAGGAAAGYMDAGFAILGVDIEDQPRYPGPFLRANVLDLDPRFLGMFDAIHASPPCQHHSALRTAPGAKRHPEMIAATKHLLRHSGRPWVLENVMGAKTMFEAPTMLCGTMFRLGAVVDGEPFELQRHRLFEASFELSAPYPCAHQDPVLGIYGGHVRNRAAKIGGRRTRDFDDVDKPSLAAEALGIDWMTMEEMSQAIPPAYTRWVGKLLMEHLRALEAAA